MVLPQKPSNVDDWFPTYQMSPIESLKNHHQVVYWTRGVHARYEPPVNCGRQVFGPQDCLIFRCTPYRESFTMHYVYNGRNSFKMPYSRKREQNLQSPEMWCSKQVVAQSTACARLGPWRNWVMTGWSWCFARAWRNLQTARKWMLTAYYTRYWVDIYVYFLHL